jgi:hypothetical protein
MNFPTLSMKPDGDSLMVEIENPAISPPKTDGGYMFTRPLYTRSPPRTWTFAYSDLGQSDYLTMEDFFKNQAKGSSVAFTWVHPVTAENALVRFSKDFKLQMTRVGIGSNHRYKTNTISLTEV